MEEKQPPQTQTSSHATMAWVMALLGLLIGAGLVAAFWFFSPKTVQTAPTTTTTQPTTSQSNNNTPAAKPASSPTACTLNDISMTGGTSDGTAGTQYLHVVLTNKGSQTCTLAGYPAVFLLDNANNVLGNGAKPGLSFTPQTITLAPGAKAHTAVGFPNAANFGTPGACTASSAALRLYLPGSASYLDMTLSKPNCPGFSATAMVAGA